MKKLSVLLCIYTLFAPITLEASITLKTQGSFFIGGKILKKRGQYNQKNWMDQKGQTRHGDHMYVFYQIPKKSRKYPVVFLHGASQSGQSWETTPDGRDGFQNIFLKHRYSVYIIDQPRCGRAGQSIVQANIDPVTYDQFLFDIFRLGLWPKFYKNTQFPTDPKSLHNFFKQNTPNLGGCDRDLVSNSVAKLFNKIGDGILITHSQGGEIGWISAMKSEKIKAIVAIEPANGFVFPRGEAPGLIFSSSGKLRTTSVDLKHFLKLTKIPIIIYFGDYIPNHPTELKGQDNWYQRLKMAEKWTDTINRYGGNAQVVHLPKIGIFGNTHFMFMDKNNQQIADLIFKFFQKNGLEK